MSFTKRLPIAMAALLMIYSAFAGFAEAKGKDTKFSDIKIDNFGQMDDRFYRGSRPKDSDYSALASLEEN